MRIILKTISQNMENRFRFIFPFLAAVFFSSLSIAQTKFVNEFLNIGVGARAHGMFNAQVASVSDGTAGYWNPAGLSSIDAPFQVGAMHAEWFAGIANYDYLSVAKQIGDKSAYGSISLIRMGIDNIPNTLSLIGPDGSVNYDNITEFSAADYGFFLSYGQKIGERLSLGGSAKVIRRTLSSFGGAWGFGMDFGLQYQLPRFSFGVMGRDITTTYNSWVFNLTEEEQAVFISTGNEIPTSSTEIALPKVILGFAYHSIEDNGKDFSYLFEANVNVNTDGRASGLIESSRFALEPTVGGEVGYKQLVFLRAGVGNMQRLVNDFNVDDRSFAMTPSLGLGLKLKRVRIDYALNNIGTQGSEDGAFYSHIFSLSVDFAPKKG